MAGEKGGAGPERTGAPRERGERRAVRARGNSMDADQAFIVLLPVAVLCPRSAAFAKPALIVLIVFYFAMLAFRVYAATASRRTRAGPPYLELPRAPPASVHAREVPGSTRLVPSIHALGIDKRRVPPSCRLHPPRRDSPLSVQCAPTRVCCEQHDKQCTCVAECVSIPYASVQQPVNVSSTALTSCRQITLRR